MPPSAHIRAVTPTAAEVPANASSAPRGISRHMRNSLAGLALGAIASLPSAADAQWREETPGGEWYFHSSVTLAGRFSCLTPFRTPGSSCLASGNSVTITNGGGWMTLTYVGGRVLEFDAHYTKTNTYSLGHIERSFGGTEPFVMPSVFTSAHTVLSFGNGIVGATWFGFEGGGRLGAKVPTESPGTPAAWLATRPLPAPYLSKYVMYWHHLDPNSGAQFNLNSTDTSPILLVGSVSLIAPEPSTWALLGTGLLTLGGLAVRRRKRVEF